MSNATVLRCEQLAKSYREGPQALAVIKGVDLSIAKGECVAIIGASGSGKSTLLNLLAGIDLPDSGAVYVADKNLAQLSERERARMRNKCLGFVYQFHHLLPEFSALENVCMPLLIGGDSPQEARSKAAVLLERVGLAERLAHKPAELSGGERQRVAIARALVTKPDCVLLDEPTGNLDRKTAQQVQDLLIALNQEFGVSLIVVTHDLALTERMTRVYQLCDGVLTRTTG